MKVWPALILAPLLALASIALGYALVPGACAGDAGWRLHALVASCLAAGLALTALASRAIARHREPFLALVATWAGGFFSFVIAAQWLVLFLAPACMG